MTVERKGERPLLFSSICWTLQSCRLHVDPKHFCRHFPRTRSFCKTTTQLPNLKNFTSYSYLIISSYSDLPVFTCPNMSLIASPHSRNQRSDIAVCLGVSSGSFNPEQFLSFVFHDFGIFKAPPAPDSPRELSCRCPAFLKLVSLSGFCSIWICLECTVGQSSCAWNWNVSLGAPPSGVV